MSTSKSTTPGIRRTTHHDPRPDQLSQLAAIQKVLFGRRNHRNSTTFDLLSSAGYDPLWRRVRWTGGIGSYVVMRGCVLRVLVSATKSGYSGSKFEQYSPAPGLLDWRLHPGKSHGYRYGWCIEIR